MKDRCCAGNSLTSPEGGSPAPAALAAQPRHAATPQAATAAAPAGRRMTGPDATVPQTRRLRQTRAAPKPRDRSLLWQEWSLGQGSDHVRECRGECERGVGGDRGTSGGEVRCFLQDCEGGRKRVIRVAIGTRSRLIKWHSSFMTKMLMVCYQCSCRVATQKHTSTPACTVATLVPTAPRTYHLTPGTTPSA